MRGHDGERYGILAVDKAGQGQEIREEGVMHYRTRTVEAGPMLYVRAYPVYRRAADLREAREKVGRMTGEAMQRVNRTRSALKLEQWIHANFAEHDLFLTLTYAEEYARVGDDEVRRDVQNYIKRLRRKAKKAGKVLKYIYVLELPDRNDGDMRGYRETTGWHVHMVLSGVDRDTAEEAWPYGYGNGRHLKDSKERFTGIAKYMLKRRDSWRSWEHSRNCVEPDVKYTDRRPGKAKIMRLADDVRAYGREIFEKIYTGYELIEDAEVRTSEFVSGAYIYARMRRRA